MRALVTLFFILVFYTGTVAQGTPGVIDSLQRLLLDTRKTDPGSRHELTILLNLCYHSKEPIVSSRYGHEALELARSMGDKRREAYALSYLGSNENSLGNSIKSIDYYIQAINLNHELNMTQLEAMNLGNVARVFARMGDQVNMSSYNQKAINLLASLNDTLSIAIIQMNMGEFYRKYNIPDSAIYYYNASLNNLEAIKNEINKGRITENRATNIGNLGMIYLSNGNTEQARPYLEEANNYFTEHFEPYRKSVYQCELGKLYIQDGNQEKAEKLIKESMNMAIQAQLKEQIRDISLVLSEFYEQQKKPQLALNYFKQYKLYDDSLKNVENVRMLEQQQSQFQLSRKDEEIASLNKINKLQRILGLVLFLGVLTVIVFIFIVSRANKRIKIINAEIRKQKQLVEEREEEKALLLRELNHRVKNNLQMVASLLSLHARQLKDHPAAEALLAGKFRVEALTLIHQKLYRDDIDTKIDLKDYIEELAQNLVMNFSRDFNLDLHLKSFVMKIDKAIPLGLILNELLTNSLKYGKIEGKQALLKISIKQLPETIILTIEDNGKGLPEDFDFAHAESFGLKLVHSLIKQLDGHIEWRSHKGTQWKITLNTSKVS